MSEKIKLNLFVNKSIIGKDIFNRTFGIEFSL